METPDVDAFSDINGTLDRHSSISVYLNNLERFFHRIQFLCDVYVTNIYCIVNSVVILSMFAVFAYVLFNGLRRASVGYIFQLVTYTVLTIMSYSNMICPGEASREM